MNQKMTPLCFFKIFLLDISEGTGPWELNSNMYWIKLDLQKQHFRGDLGKGALKICSKFTGEHPCRSGISIKLLCNFIEITLRYGCSPVNLLHIFRTPFFKNTSGRLLLLIASSCDIPCWIVKDVLQKQPRAVFYKKRCS